MTYNTTTAPSNASLRNHQKIEIQHSEQIIC
jgi:hypothetical protein